MFYYSLNNLKKMKKLILGLLTAVFMVSGAMAQGFEEGCVIYLRDYMEIPNSEGKSAMCVKIVNYDNVYKLQTQYSIGGYGYTDDGKGYDRTANDGIYTSVLVKVRTSTGVIDKNSPIKSTKFKYLNNILAEQPNGKITWGFGFSCDIGYTTEGNDSFGYPCSRSGCILISGCSIVWGWGI